MAVQACHECHAETVVLYYVGRQHFAKRCASCGHRWNEERESSAPRETGKNYYPREAAATS